MTYQRVGLALVALVALTLASCSVPEQAKARTVVAGLTVHEIPVPLTGRLLFLADTNRASLERHRREDSATVYEYTLNERSLRILTRAPRGEFVPSKSGGSFVVHWMDHNPSPPTYYDGMAWGYSARTHSGSGVTLYSDVSASAPGSMVVVGESAFFDVHSPAGGGPGILRFNFATGEKNFLNVPRGSSPAPHQAENNANVLHVQGAWDSWYGFDLLTGQSAPVTCTMDRFEFRSADGRYVFFEGSEAPIIGHTLVSSPRDSFATSLGDVEREQVRVLARFSRLRGGYYSLNGLSPCRRYALVCLNKAMREGWGRTYYVVDVSSGDSWVLLKDEVCRQSGGFVSSIYWLSDE